uniref:Uncharacterized protein n=1 Tax=Panagrolaimus sp. ES5 TaxID=591445 RepID=A0AC34G433_9BILA
MKVNIINPKGVHHVVWKLLKRIWAPEINVQKKFMSANTKKDVFLSLNKESNVAHVLILGVYENYDDAEKKMLHVFICKISQKAWVRTLYSEIVKKYPDFRLIIYDAPRDEIVVTVKNLYYIQKEAGGISLADAAFSFYQLKKDCGNSCIDWNKSYFEDSETVYCASNVAMPLDFALSENPTRWSTSNPKGDKEDDF